MTIRLLSTEVAPSPAACLASGCTGARSPAHHLRLHVEAGPKDVATLQEYLRNVDRGAAQAALDIVTTVRARQPMIGKRLAGLVVVQLTRAELTDPRALERVLTWIDVAVRTRVPMGHELRVAFELVS